MKTKVQGRYKRFNSSLRSLECNRRELSEPWNAGVSPAEPIEETMNTRELDPPDMKDGSDERSKKELKVNVAYSKRPDPVARTTPVKLTSSRIHPTTAAAREDTPRSSGQVPGKPRESNTKNLRLYRRVKAESQKIVDRALKKLSRRGLYEEFPERKPERSEELHISSLTCSSINEDGLFVDDIDWANSSVDWGFGS